jgi:hypothetical protein
VLDIARGRICGEDFIDGAFEEVQGTDRWVCGKIRGTEFAPGDRENEGGVDNAERHTTSVEKSGEAAVSAARVQWSPGQTNVVADDGCDVVLGTEAHTFFLRRAAASFWLS